MREFMTARIDAILEKHCFRLAGTQTDKNLNPLRVGIISESQFRDITKDVCLSLDEYYEDFLTCKIHPSNIQNTNSREDGTK